ncbi:MULTISPECIES: glycosyltransferase family 4 protein [Sphingobacterium]|uniref:glycosyltransferase family 4 protein n=1 Tax=Sphingobacterium TaxID=28453 RepID=UPI0013D97A89|nr:MULTISPECIES: glycosyltransferase family 1 protein [unclassified Sphingobacterium]
MFDNIKKHIYYDANFSVGEFRGMGKYINFFRKTLESKGFVVKGLLTKNLKDHKSISFGFSNYILWEQFSLPCFLYKNKGLYIYPYNTAPIWRWRKNSTEILIVHDLIFFDNFGDNLTFKQKIGKAYRKFILPKIIKDFDHVITVSEYSKVEIVKKFGIDNNKIFVIPNSIELTTANTEKKENYIFHLGGEPDYKNTKTLIKAFSLLPNDIKDNFKLKIVGIRNVNSLREFKLICDELCIADKVEFLGYLSDEAIKLLYKRAQIFVFTSFKEGFGIPLIEAMNNGTAVISSNSSCLPEVGGEAAMYFDPLNSKELSLKIIEVLNDADIREKMVIAGYKNVKRFSETQIEAKIVDFLQILNNENTNNPS